MQPLKQMQDSRPMLDQGDDRALYDRFREEGYLLLRGLIPKETALAAGEEARTYLTAENGM